jgi:hypothetical protein
MATIVIAGRASTLACEEIDRKNKRFVSHGSKEGTSLSTRKQARYEDTRMRTRNVVAMGALLAALAGARSAAAQGPSTNQGGPTSASERVAARHLMDEGDTYTEQKKLGEALRVYVAAHAIMRVPTTGIEVARALAALGRLVEAREAAFAITRMPVEPNEPKPFAAARHEAAELDADLDQRIPTLRIALSGGADPAVVHASIDDNELPGQAITLPQRVDPGKRLVRVRAAGFAPVDREVDVPESSTTVVHVDLDSASPLPFGLPPLAVVGLSAAAAGLTIGSITGIISLDKASDARTLCGPDPKNCDPSAAGSISSSKTYGWIATGSFALAVAGGALATYTLLSKPTTTKASAPRVDLVLTAGGAGMRGTF